MRKVLVIALLGALALGGCTYRQALVLARDAAASNLAFERAVTTAHKDGAIDDATEQRLLIASRKVAVLDDAVVTAIEKQHDKKGAIANIDQGIATIDEAITSGIAEIKNPAKQTEFHAILLGLRGTLVTAKSLLS